MAAESNLGFCRDGPLGAALDHHAISFQSGSQMIIPFGSCFGMDTSAVGEMVFPVNSCLTDSSTGVGQVQGSSSTCSPRIDPVSGGLKHDSGLAADWSVEEQYTLEEALAQYSDEPRIMSYIKIAAMLPDKTVRDVALRCRWITFLAAILYSSSNLGNLLSGGDFQGINQNSLERKRRKNEENNVGKRVHNRKDSNDSHSYSKHMETSSKMNWPPQQAEMFAAPPHPGNHLDMGHASPLEGISGPVTHLLEQNFKALNQITANISSFKVQDNIDLFGQTRVNIEAILNGLKEMPGIMSQMPPLPVCIDEDLVHCIFPNTIQSMMHGSHTGTRLKQEPSGF